MKQLSVYRINLNNMDGDGSFPCPSCGILISPDDVSEETYRIIDMETYEDGTLKTLSLMCKKCGAKIVLEGFEILRTLENL